MDPNRWMPSGADQGGLDDPPAPRDSGAGRGGAAAHRLDKRTYLDSEQGRWSVVLKDYGQGLGEVGWSFVPNLKPRVKACRGESEVQELNQDRASRRARSRLRQLILASGTDHLLTLTYRENLTDYGRACADLNRFVRRVKKHLPDWTYIAVPEKQKRGAWHWHLAVIGRQDVTLLRSLWRGVVGDGNIDVEPPKGGKNPRLSLVKYLGKYLAKGFTEGHRELNGHRYRASHGIRVNVESVAVPENRRASVEGFALEHLKSRTGSVGFAWIDPMEMAGWACSWE